ncbi:MAG: hypothetical protein ACTSSP_11995 [Candidatus Asgardarchaeia archaeon]
MFQIELTTDTLYTILVLLIVLATLLVLGYMFLSEEYEEQSTSV